MTLYQLTSQWNVKQEHMYGKREQLRALLREVGAARFRQTIENLIRDYAGEYCPTIAAIRQYLPQPPGRRSFRRDPDCPQCKGSGWYYVSDSDADRIYGTHGAQAVKRCNRPDCSEAEKNHDAGQSIS